MRLQWQERGGPPVKAERGRGFGTDLIEKIVANELDNPVQLVFGEQGVTLHADHSGAPADRVRHTRAAAGRTPPR